MDPLPICNLIRITGQKADVLKARLQVNCALQLNLKVKEVK